MTAFFRSLKWLEPVVDLARLGCFTVFVLLALWHMAAVLRHASEDVVRLRAKLLIGFVVTATLLAGITQISAWPFATWALVHTSHSTHMVSWELEGIDASGRGYEIDPRVMQPMMVEEFGAWLIGRTPTLTPAERDELLRFVLIRANAQRQRFLAGQFPPDDRFLGAASAPAHFQMRHVWRSPNDVPANPFVAVRIWRFDWDTEERARNHQAFQRTLLAGQR